MEHRIHYIDLYHDAHRSVNWRARILGHYLQVRMYRSSPDLSLGGRDFIFPLTTMSVFSSDKRTTSQILEVLQRLWEAPHVHDNIEKNRNANAQEKKTARDTRDAATRKGEEWDYTAKKLNQHIYRM